MINHASNSLQVAQNLPVTAETGASSPATSGQPTLSSRDPAASSLLPPSQSLHSAAKTNNVSTVLDAFRSDRTAINAVDPQTGLTPLQTALNGNHHKAAKTLIKLGARVHNAHLQSRPEDISLHAASELGDLELLEKVLNLSLQDLNAWDRVSGLTPLSFALRGFHLGAARMLLVAGAKPEMANRDRSIPLNKARLAGKADAIKLLLDYGAPIDQKDGKGMTLLRDATLHGEEETVKLLLARKADVHQLDDQGRTLLFDAIGMCQSSIILLLLDHGINIEHADEYGRTAFSHAAALGRVKEAEILLTRGANQKHVSHLQGTPIMIAARNGELEFLELLLPAEKRLLDTKDWEGNTVLHLAALKGHDAAVLALIKSGADLRTTNGRGNTPLALAARRGHIQTMALLLDAEQDVAHAAKNARAILNYAVKKGDVPGVEFLLQRGTDVDEKTTKLAKEPLMAEMLLHANLLTTGQVADPDNTLWLSLDGSELMNKLLNTAVRNKNADSWPVYMANRRISPTLSSALESAAKDTRQVWTSLAGDGQKITPAQQKHWCAGILANLGNTMLHASPYSEAGLTPATRTLLETIAQEQIQAIATAAAAAEQPLREGMADLLGICKKAVYDDQFYPMDLFRLLTGEHGVYHNVASLIVSAFADVWPRRNGLDDAKLAQAFAEKVLLLKQSHKALRSMNHDTATAGNQYTVSMLMFRQLDLLQQWIDDALVSPSHSG